MYPRGLRVAPRPQGRRAGVLTKGVAWPMSCAWSFAGMPARAEHFDAKATVLIENITHHIEEEEAGLVPRSTGRPQPQTASGSSGQKLSRPGRRAPGTALPPAR